MPVFKKFLHRSNVVTVADVREEANTLAQLYTFLSKEEQDTKIRASLPDEDSECLYEEEMGVVQESLSEGGDLYKARRWQDTTKIKQAERRERLKDFKEYTNVLTGYAKKAGIEVTGHLPPAPFNPAEQSEARQVLRPWGEGPRQLPHSSASIRPNSPPGFEEDTSPPPFHSLGRHLLYHPLARHQKIHYGNPF